MGKKIGLELIDAIATERLSLNTEIRTALVWCHTVTQVKTVRDFRWEKSYGVESKALIFWKKDNCDLKQKS